jgi:hypothetical protein
LTLDTSPIKTAMAAKIRVWVRVMLKTLINPNWRKARGENDQQDDDHTEPEGQPVFA